jgi:hypothetical protein
VNPYTPIKLFISYSSDDAGMERELEKHLGVLLTCGRVGPEVWTQDRIAPGADWRVETLTAIERTELALLLVSASYLSAAFLNDVELPALLRRRSEAGLVVIPVILRSCLWTEHPALEGLRPIPSDGTSMAGHAGDARDEQYAMVAKAIAVEFRRRTGGGSM